MIFETIESTCHILEVNKLPAYNDPAIVLCCHSVLLVCGLFLFERKLICVGFNRVFVYLLSLKIQFTEGGGGGGGLSPFNWYNSVIFCA